MVASKGANIDMAKENGQTQSVLGEMAPSKSIIKLAIPATLALLAKAVYNLVDTAYIGILNSDIALTAVGVTVPLLLIVLRPVHPDPAQAVRRGRHLCLPTRRRRSDHSGLHPLRTSHEAHRLEEHAEFSDRIIWQHDS